MASEDTPVSIIDSNDIGVFAAHLLIADNITPYNKAKYILNRPKDITRRQIITIIKEYISTKVKDISFRDTSFVNYIASQSQESKNIIRSIKHTPETAWEGKCRVSTTSKEVLQLAAPKRSPAKVLRVLLEH